MTVQHMEQNNTTMRKRVTLFAFAMAGFVVNPVWAQGQQIEDPHAGHRMMSPPAQPLNQDSDKEGGMAGTKEAPTMDMGATDMGSMQGGSPPPDARDPHAYAEGYDFGPMKLRLADTHSLGALLVDNLEAVRSDGNTSTAYDLQAWYGRTYDRAVLKAEGDYDNSEIQDARTELLWGHAIAAFWDTQLGVRHDSGEGPNRNSLAFGVQGLAPYWFEVEATGYVGESGRTALRLDASYELLLTQKWILQPRIEANAYGKDDTDRGLGSGLSDVSVALRLRYEIRREFAPYVGVEWASKFGDTKDLARAAGEDTNETRLVAGLRFWF
jgi:copper resistance protein B